MSVEPTLVSVRGGMFETEVYSKGSGDPLVFLHGGGATTGWGPLHEALSRDFSVIAPRHPGWGESTGLDHLDDVVDMALFYLDLFDAMGLESVNLVGESVGAMFAAEIAALGGSYVRRLVLQGAPGLWIDGLVPPDFFTMTMEEATGLTFHDPATMARMPGPNPEDIEAVKKAQFEGAKSLAALGKFIWPLWDKGLKKRIHRIKAPTLLVWGESDGLVPTAYASEFQRLIPGSKLTMMPETGHLPSLEQPERYAAILREFLQAP